MTTLDARGDEHTDEPEYLGSIERDERSWWSRNREAFSLRSAGAIYALAILVIFFSVRSSSLGRPAYLSEGNVGNLLEQTSLIGIMSIGMTVLLISGNFDLSVASNAAMSSMATAMVVDSIGPVLAVLVGLSVGTLGGLVNGLIHWYVGLNSFIVTLGTLTAYRGIVLYLNDGQEKLISRDSAETLRSWAGEFIGTFELLHIVALALAAGAGAMAVARNRQAAALFGGGAVLAFAGSLFTDYELRIAHQAFYMLILLAVVWFGLRFTVPGRRLYATGGNLEAARAAGIVVARYRIIPFVLVGFTAGMAGVINISRVGAVAPALFETRELEVIAAAIIGGVALTGGKGSVIKTIIGAALLFVMTNGFTIIGLSPFITEIAIGTLVILSAAAYVFAERRAAAAGKV